MDFVWEEEYADFRDAVRAFIADWRTPELLAEYARTYGGGGERIRAFHEAIHERGWMRMCWPREYGGEGRSPKDGHSPDSDPIRSDHGHGKRRFAPLRVLDIRKLAHDDDPRSRRGHDSFCTIRQSISDLDGRDRF